MLFHALRRILRKPLPALAVLLFAAILAAILCGLQHAAQEEVEEYGHVYRSTPVTLTVSDLTGTQTDDLELPSWALKAFDSHSLKPYVKDVHAKVTLTNIDSVIDPYLGQAFPGFDVVGISSPEIDSQLSAQNGHTIDWMAGYDESILLTDEAVCIIPQSCTGDGYTPESLEISFSYTPYSLNAVTQYYSAQFKVVGVLTSDLNQIYCPFSMALKANSAVGKALSMDAITATVSDNDTLDIVCEESSRWFAEPDLTGEQTPWDFSWYTHYPFALIIDDSQLVAAAETLENSMRLNKICTMAVFALSAAAGFFIGFLMIRQRKREIALMRTMGTPDKSIFCSFAFEQLLCALLGIAVGGAYFLWQPPGHLCIFAAVYFAGLSLALLIFLRRNLLTTIKEDE